MGDNRSRTGDAPGDEGPGGSVADPAARSGPGDDETSTVVSGGSGEEGTGSAAADEVAADDESEPTRSE
jgi:hypothetical protein